MREKRDEHIKSYQRQNKTKTLKKRKAIEGESLSDVESVQGHESLHPPPSPLLVFDVTQDETQEQQQQQLLVHFFFIF